MNDLAIRVEHVSKEYRLGMIGGTTLKADLQRLWAKLRGQEDPNSKIGTDGHHAGERFLALDDVSFEVRQGEALGIIGRNGAGKSTLLKLLTRVTAPTQGRISYNGRIASMLEVGTGFHGELSGRENIYMNGAILGMTKKEIDRKLDEIIAFAEMEQFIDTPVKRYSSGMYVKLAFAVAAHLDAEIMIMDEVLAVGDRKFQQKCLGRMNDAANKEGRTILFVSHNMEAVNRLCNKGMLLAHGKNVFFGDAPDAISRYMAEKNNFSEYIDVPPSGKKQFQITKAWLCDCRGNRKNEFSTAEPIRLQLEIFCEKIPDEQVISLSLYDRWKKRLFTNDVLLRDFMKGEKTHCACIEYEPFRFTEGQYSWHLCIHHPFVEVLDLQDDVCKFQVVDTQTPLSKYTPGSYGSFFMNYNLDGKNYPL